MNVLKRISRKLNHVFIVLILFFVYILAIGLTRILHALFQRQTETTTFWQQSTRKHDWSSPY